MDVKARLRLSEWTIDTQCYLPTPAQIRMACDAIQLGWSLRERRKRLVAEPHWDPPCVVLRIEEEEQDDVTRD